MRKAFIFLYYVLFFIAGATASVMYTTVPPSITGSAVHMPADYISDGQILVYPDQIVIKVAGSRISNYEATGSMMPILGYGANGIVIVPQSEEDIYVGDIVTYHDGDKLIVHRVIEKGRDSEGIYFITKGDSNGFSDGKIRFVQIEHKLIGLLY